MTDMKPEERKQFLYGDPNQKFRKSLEYARQSNNDQESFLQHLTNAALYAPGRNELVSVLDLFVERFQNPSRITEGQDQSKNASRVEAFLQILAGRLTEKFIRTMNFHPKLLNLPPFLKALDCSPLNSAESSRLLPQIKEMERDQLPEKTFYAVQGIKMFLYALLDDWNGFYRSFEKKLLDVSVPLLHQSFLQSANLFRYTSESLRNRAVQSIVSYYRKHLREQTGLLNLKKQHLSTFLQHFFELYNSTNFGRPEKMYNLVPQFHQFYGELVERNRTGSAIDCFRIIDFLFHSRHDEQSWKEFVERYGKDHRDYIRSIAPDNSENRPKEEPKKPVNIAYFLHQASIYSPAKDLVSLLRGAQDVNEGSYSFDLFITGEYGLEKADFLRFMEQCLPKVTFHSARSYQPGKADSYEWMDNLRERVQEADPDVAVFCRDQFCGYLAESRVAPVQIFFSHGNPYFGYGNIDGYQTHFQSMKEWEEHDDVLLHHYPLLEIFTNPGGKDENVQEVQSKFSDFSFLYGSLGRLVKLNRDRFLETVAQILRRKEDACFIFGGDGEEDEIQEFFRERGLEERTFYEGFVDAHVYGHAFDAFLSPFPEFGGQTEVEMMAKGTPVVSMSYVNSDDPEERNYPRTDCVKGCYGVEGLYVEDGDQDRYVDIAVRLADDQEFYEKCSEKTRKTHVRRVNPEAVARKCLSFYDRLLRKKT